MECCWNPRSSSGALYWTNIFVFCYTWLTISSIPHVQSHGWKNSGKYFFSKYFFHIPIKLSVHILKSIHFKNSVCTIFVKLTKKWYFHQTFQPNHSWHQLKGLVKVPRFCVKHCFKNEWTLRHLGILYLKY